MDCSESPAAAQVSVSVGVTVAKKAIITYTETMRTLESRAFRTLGLYFGFEVWEFLGTKWMRPHLASKTQARPHNSNVPKNHGEKH